MTEIPQQLLSCFKNKKIVVTGASGYIGSKLVDAIKDYDCLICRVSRKKNTLPVISGGCARIMDYEGPVQDRRLWKRVLPESDIVFHLSSQTNLNFARDNVMEDWKANVLPIQQLLECCRQTKISPTVVFSGTATQVGLTSKLPVSEVVPDLPVTIYDLHKLNAEDYLKTYSAQSFVKGVSLRLSNVYGPGSASMNKDRGIINQMTAKAIDGQTLTVYGEGKFIRDYVFIDDIITAFFYSARFIDRLKAQHFLVGSGEGVCISDAIRTIAEKVQQISGKKVTVEHVPEPPLLHPIERRNFIADITSFRLNTGWTPETVFEKGIEETVIYSFKNKDVKHGR